MLIRNATAVPGKKTYDNLAKLLEFVLAGKNWCMGSRKANMQSQNWTREAEMELPFVAECILQHDRCQQEEEFHNLLKVAK